MNDGFEPTPFHRRLAGFLHRHALTIVLSAIGLTVAAGMLAGTRLQLVSDRSELMDPDSDVARRWREYKADFHYRETLVVVVRGSEDAAKPGWPGATARRRMKEFAHRVAEDLRRHPEEIPGVFERVDPQSMSRLGLLYLPEADLRSLARRVIDAEPLIRSALEQGLTGVFEGLREALDRAAEDAGSGDAAAGAGGALNALTAIADALELAGRGRPEEAVEAFGSALDPAGGPGVFRDPDGYIFFGAGRYLLLPIAPRVNSQQLNQLAAPVALIRAALARHRTDYPEIACGVTGRAAVASDEMATTNRDMTWATIGSVFGVLVLFRIFFRGLLHPLAAVFTLSMALAWTFGFATLAQGRLNLFAMVFAPILVGLGIDFGIYFLTHWLHAVRGGRSGADAIAATFQRCLRPMVVGCVTTSVAFLSACLTEFRGLSELGLLCGVGLLICLFAMITVFPSLLCCVERWRPGAPAAKGASRIGFEAPAPPYRPWLPIVVGAVAVAAAAFGAGQDFNYDILSFQAKGTESVEWEHVLIEEARLSSYAISICDSREELDRRRKAFLARPELFARVEALFPAAEETKRAVLGELRAALESLPLTSPDPTAAPEPPGRACRRALALLRQDFRSYSTREERARATLERPLAVLSDLLGRWEAGEDAPGPDGLAPNLARFQDALVRFLRARLSLLLEQCSPGALTVETAPEIFRTRFAGEGGKLALHVYATENVWAWRPLNRFAEGARAIDPEVTGIPLNILEASGALHRSFQQSILYALVAIFLIVLVDFRRIPLTLLALLPLLTGLGLLVGCLRGFGLAFNFANYFAVPILIGCGVDGGVHMVHAFRAGTTAGTFRAVLGCSLTTIVGFGTMMLARHRGLSGLGTMLVLGMIFITAIALGVLPAALSRPRNQGEVPTGRNGA